MIQNKPEQHIIIVDYRQEHHARFKAINEQWIRDAFEMEEEDVKTLEDPESYILKNGGRIFIACYKEEIVGTCAYLNFGNGEFEMIKMAVDRKYRGLGIGKKLGEDSLDRMRSEGARKIFLFSNTTGSSRAVDLYRKLGFTEVPLGTTEFKRADIRMELFF